MSENVTDDTVHCGDPTALVSYLYDEGTPDERAAIAAHLAVCTACAAEIEALGAARRMLPAWTPPAAALGFQIGSRDASARLLRPSRWWQRPLPAWAQAAAAVAIFVAGVSAGGARGADAPAGGGADGGAVPLEVTAVPPPAGPSMPRSVVAEPSRFGAMPVPVAVSAVSREDLARVEGDLRAELARIEQAQRALGAGMLRARSPQTADAAAEDGVTMERVQALMQEREDRQRELIQGMAQVLIDVDARHRRDIVAMQTTVDGLGRDTMTTRSSMAALVSVVSGQSGFRPVSGR